MFTSRAACDVLNNSANMMPLHEHPQWVQDVLVKLPPQISNSLAAQKPELLIAVAVVLITILISTILQIVFRPRGGKRGSAIIIAGPCNSGKTTLFLQLRDGTMHNGTVASMQENTGVVAVRNDKGRTIGAVKVIDVPGHERLRYKLEQCLDDASAVVFVIDAADITPHKVEAAEELFEVLTHPSIAKRKIPILIACNKMDLDTQAHSVDFVRRTVERQLDSMRRTRTTLSSEAAARAAVLGKPTAAPAAGASGPGAAAGGAVGLSLSSLRTPVSTASISALKGDLEEVYAFLVPFAR